MTENKEAGAESAAVEPSEDKIREILASRAPRRIDPEGWKIAAVLVPIFLKDGRWHVLLTRRTDKVEQHKGEISFPGGHRDPEDPDLVFTALREAEEEVGIPKEGVKVLGRLDDIITITGFRIRPFVGVIPYPFEVKPAEEEIAEVIVLPFHRFLAPDRFIRREIVREGQPYLVYYFYIDGYNVLGATGKILAQFLKLAMGFREPAPEK